MTDWGGDCPAGGLVQDSGPWEALRDFDHWAHGSPLLLPAQEEAALEASWETLPLYLQDQKQ